MDAPVSLETEIKWLKYWLPYNWRPVLMAFRQEAELHEQARDTDQKRSIEIKTLQRVESVVGRIPKLRGLKQFIALLSSALAESYADRESALANEAIQPDSDDKRIEQLRAWLNSQRQGQAQAQTLVMLRLIDAWLYERRAGNEFSGR
jgi:hypothetical protein